MLATTLPTPLYPLYQRRLGFSALMITLIYSTYAVGVLIALLVVGRISDQVGRRRVLLPGLVVSAASSIAFLAVGGLAPLFLGRILSGLSAGVFTGTATATLVDLAPEDRKGRASLVATAVNMGGLGLGPLLAGLLANFGPVPVRLPFIVSLALLVPAVLGVWAIPETVKARPGARPHLQALTVPASVRPTFVRSAIAGFAGFAVLGLFTAVAPSFLGTVLHDHSPALSGSVVFVAFAASTVGQLALERVPGQLAMPAGCVALVAGMGLIAGALSARSLALLIAGAAVAGLGQGMSFRAGLGAVNAESPPDQRGEVASAFFVVLYVALSLPVVGVGLAADSFGLATAGIVFSAAVAVLALVALVSLVRAPGAGLLRQGGG